MLYSTFLLWSLETQHSSFTGFTNITCYHTVDKNVNNGRNTHCHFIEYNRGNKLQSRLMTQVVLSFMF